MHPNTSSHCSTYVLDFVNDQSWVSSWGGNVVIPSQAGTPGFKSVEQVRCGRLVDTQRRRRNALDELYVSAALG